MGQSMVTNDLFYDLVSIQYHALKGQDLYTKFCQDAQGQQEILRFFEQVQQQDVERAKTCHELLSRISGGGEPYPSEGRTASTTRTGAPTT